MQALKNLRNPFATVCLIAVALGAGSAHAQLELHDLGHLDGSPVIDGDTVFISADGQTVVGNSGERSFRWHAGTMTEIPPGARATNADGSVVVGQSGSPAHAFRWSVAGGLQDLGELAGVDGVTVANGVSADGSIVVGDTQGTSPSHAWTWNAADGMHDIGSLMPGTTTWARGVSADGSIVVGYSWGHAFRWTATTGMIAIADNDLPAGASVAANAISGDGSTVVGTYNPNPSAPHNLPLQFRALDGGQVTDLLLRGWGVPTTGAALAVSTDGSRIVGFTDIHYHASLWTDQSGTVDLNDWLPLQGVPTAGWSFIEATGISGDGDAIVGVARYVDGSINEPRLFLLTGVTSALPIFANGFDDR